MCMYKCQYRNQKKFGGLGVCDPQGCRGTGRSPVIRRAMRERRVACEANTRPARRLQMRTPQREAEKVCRECYPGTPRRSPRPGSGGARAGGALRKPPRRAQRARMGGAGRGKPLAHHPTGASGDRAPTERPSAQPGTGARLPRRGTAVGGCGLAAGPGVCYGWRAPSRRPGGGLERGRRLAPTRAPPLWSERSERNRRGAQPRGWEGVGPQAMGCGLLLPGSRGHPFPVSVIAQ